MGLPAIIHILGTRFASVKMPTTQVEVEGFSGLSEALAEILTDVYAAALSPGYAPVLAQITTDLTKGHATYFDRAHDPSGQPWAPLRPSTIERKGHSTILVDTGALKASLTQTSGTNATRETHDEGNRGYVTFGTSVEYAGYHMTGTPKMVARPHTGTNEQQATDFAEKVADHIVAVLAKE